MARWVARLLPLLLTTPGPFPLAAGCQGEPFEGLGIRILRGLSDREPEGLIVGCVEPQGVLRDLAPGDRILSAEGKRVQSLGELRWTLDYGQPLLLVERDGRRLLVRGRY